MSLPDETAEKATRNWFTSESGHVLAKPALLVALTGAVVLAAYAVLRLDPNSRTATNAAMTRSKYL